MYTYSFEKLEVWKLAKELTLIIYKLTDDFPQEEKFGLISQIRRCSISISSNLAEGSTRKSMKEQAHFTQIAYGSWMELLNQLIISLELSYFSEDEMIDIRPKVEELANKLNSFRNSQLRKSSNQQINLPRRQAGRSKHQHE